MKLRNNKKPSFAPRKQKLGGWEILNRILMVLTGLDLVGIDVIAMIKGLITEIIIYISNKI